VVVGIRACVGDFVASLNFRLPWWRLGNWNAFWPDMITTYANEMVQSTMYCIKAKVHIIK